MGSSVVFGYLHIKTKRATGVLKIYFVAYSEKASSQFIENSKKKIQVKTLCHVEFKSRKGSNKTIIQGSVSLKLFNLLEYQFPLLKPENVVLPHYLTKILTFCI